MLSRWCDAVFRLVDSTEQWQAACARADTLSTELRSLEAALSEIQGLKVQAEQHSSELQVIFCVNV